MKIRKVARQYYEGKKTAKAGRLILDKNNSTLKLLDFRYLSLNTRKKVSEHFPKREAVLVLLKGRCSITVGGRKYLLGLRKNVFKNKSHSLYIPPNVSFTCSATSSQTEIAIVTTPASSSTRKVVSISPRKVCVKKVGSDTYKRTVHTIFTKKIAGNDSHLLVGETFNAEGKWSSFPPHKHVRDNLPHETRYEEVYFFKVNPHDGFGLIRIYDEQKESVYCIRNNDCFIVTKGYHPICAAPGCCVYYMWAMTGAYPSVVNKYDAVFRHLPR